MNQDHYDRVKRISDKSRTAWTEMLRKENLTEDCEGDNPRLETVKHLFSSIRSLCAEFWKEEFYDESKSIESLCLDLSGADLSGGFFAGDDSAGNPLEGVNLRDAKLDDSRWLFNCMKKADLTGASLCRAFIRGIDCEGSSFRRTNLSHTSLDFRVLEDQQTIDFTAAILTESRIIFLGPLPVILGEAKMAGCRLATLGMESSKKGRDALGQFVDNKIAAYCKKGVDAFLAVLTEEQRSQVIIEDRSTKTITSTKAGDAKCFIATAACGSQWAPDVVRLREFRDLILLQSAFGSVIVRLYEFGSPPIARLIESSELGRKIVLHFIIRPSRWGADLILKRRIKYVRSE